MKLSNMPQANRRIQSMQLTPLLHWWRSQGMIQFLGTGTSERNHMKEFVEISLMITLTWTHLQRFFRNAWSDVRNTALVAFVKASPCPTPWRPRHGTNKEVWMDIALNIVARQDIFDVAVHWSVLVFHHKDLFLASIWKSLRRPTYSPANALFQICVRDSCCTS